MNQLTKTKVILTAIYWFTFIVVLCSVYELATYFLNQKNDISNLVGMAMLVAIILGLLITIWDTIKNWKTKIKKSEVKIKK